MGLGFLNGFLIGVIAFGIAYLIAATIAVRRFMALSPKETDDCPPVTILKPLCGGEPQLEENLLSFTNLDYPTYQVIYGVGSSSDDAVTVVKKVVEARPDIDQELVVNDRVSGRNLKVSSLRNMVRDAKHDLLVISDSDVRVTPKYLREIVGPLANPEVGLVTCLYRAKPIPNIWSFFGAMGINHGFLPAVLFSRLIGIDQGCFGATMALRRATLDEVGGFDSIKDFLSDDYALGEAVRRTGKKVVISRHLVDIIETSPDFSRLFQHEVRWGRTVRSVVPIGYAASIVTNPMVFAVVALPVLNFGWVAVAAFFATFAARFWMARTIDRCLKNRPAPVWMLPVRDVLAAIVYAVSLSGSKVVWRDRRLHVRSGGQLTTATGSDT